MPSPDGVSPLDWPALVAEAKRRRKAEGLTQRAHAELAGVSVPTMVAFDRADTGLSLTKALAILDVVGLVAPPGDPALDELVLTARGWSFRLTARSDHDPWAHGSWIVAIAWQGITSTVEPGALRTWLHSPERPRFGRWRPFSVGPRPAAGDGIEGRQWMDGDPEGLEAWRLEPSGRGVFRRTYDEDLDERVRPGRQIDPVLTIRRVLALVTDARSLARRLSGQGQIRIRSVWTGLSGRRLADRDTPSPRDEVMVETTISPEEAASLAPAVHGLASPLFAAFGNALTLEFVADEIAAMSERRR